MAPSDHTMSPIAWLFISMFAGVILILAIVYLFALKIRHDKKKAAGNAVDDKVFGNVIANPITTQEHLTRSASLTERVSSAARTVLGL
ncbi:hypothetical protein Z517_10654 [Fonsecaea pedrosoi CBS 271.37]|uniref:Uncharacterized protein n=1 Tax=Fonsecaea pedrosoi CBS 271.37 TaxID=1442368 RepID=A0A0D2GU12_9EURO|nr:uncharacterized protein Z517_10654 [Fonsecaea pedrosoi CBS 271.37]KIW75909.1 hypothetical protein Z517_10654 [Fonsecaea pedrosoi CBS 271.37]